MTLAMAFSLFMTLGMQGKNDHILKRPWSVDDSFFVVFAVVSSLQQLFSWYTWKNSILFSVFLFVSLQNACLTLSISYVGKDMVFAPSDYTSYSVERVVD